MIYYPAEIRRFIQSPGSKPAPAGQTSQQDNPPESNPEFEALEIFINDINSILQHAGKEAGKPVLLPQLKQALASYPGLRVPAYRNAVFNHIIRIGEELCGVRISEQELEG